MDSSKIKTIDQLQQNLITYFRLFAGLPGITFVEADVTWIASGKAAPGNHILQTKFSSASVAQRIDETIQQIGLAADQVDWYVFPSCQPTDLGEQVVARGLAGGPDGAWTLVGKIGGPGGNWLLADLTSLPSAPPVAARFHIEPVRDQAMLAQWLQVSLTGFGQALPPPDRLDENALYAAYARHGFGPAAYSLRYIGYLDAQPVTAGGLLLAGGIAGLFDISTPVDFRRQGFGRAISWFMLQEAHKRGYDQAYVWSSNMGKGVYASVGCRPADIGMREYQWQKKGDKNGLGA